MTNIISTELAEKHPEFTTKVAGGDYYVANSQTIGKAPLAVYFELFPKIKHCMRKYVAAHGLAPIKPSGMNLFTLIHRDVGAFALYAIDSRVNLGPGVDTNEVLTMSPNSWSESTRRNAGVQGIPGIKPSVLLPIVPYEM